MHLAVASIHRERSGLRTHSGADNQGERVFVSTISQLARLGR